MNAIARLLLILLPGLFFTLYSMQVSTVGSWAKGFATVMGDKLPCGTPQRRFQRNGPLVAFTSAQPESHGQSRTTIPKRPMKQVAARYEKGREEDQRETFQVNMTDSTVIYVLSGNPSPTRHACRDSKSTRIPYRTSARLSRIPRPA